MRPGSKAVSSSRVRDHRRSHSTLQLVFALLAFALLVGATTAFAEGGEDALDLPSVAQVTDTIASGSQSVPSLEPDLTAAEELPHEDLGRDEALTLLEGVFAPQLEAPAGIFDGLEVERFLAPDVAVLDEPEEAVGPSGPDGDGGVLAGAVLLDSTVPLRAETSSGEVEVVDLRLEPSEGELQPANPLADVGIPQELGDGIELLGPEVTIRLADAPEGRATSITEQSVGFVPNVALDTDLAIAPTPTGVETLTHLRSPDAPHAQTFLLQLPPGATLEATENGGAAVMNDGEALVGVSPPVAVDAAGSDVPVSLHVTGSALTLTATPESSAVYPILVDPLFQTYDWAKSKHGENGICSSSFSPPPPNGSCQNREEWGYELTKSPKSTGTLVQDNRHMKMYGPVPYGTPGLSIFASGPLTAGDRASILYTVPRYYTDYATYGQRPNSFISSMTLSNLDWTAGSGHMSPYVFAGIWDPINSVFLKFYSHESLEGNGVHNWSFPYGFANLSNDNGKVGYVSIQATETQPDAYAMLYVGSASIQLSDALAPTAGPIQNLPWADQVPAPVTFTAGDTGLGVHSLTVTDEAVPPHSWKTSHGCIGVSGSPCPRVWKSSDSGAPQLKYDPSVMPQGINYLNIQSEDPTGNRSSVKTIEAQVDHSKPTLDLSGTLTEQPKVGTAAAQYTLKLDARDGDAAAPAAQASVGTPGTGFGQTQRPEATAADAAGNVYVADSGCKCVQKYDKAGKFLSQFGSAQTSPTADLRGIAVAPSGNIWVTDRAQKAVYGLKPDGQPFRWLNYSGFSEPYAVAVAPDETLWVSDIGSDQVYKFLPGQSVPAATLKGTSQGPNKPLDLISPSGLALNPTGGVWVVDDFLNRVTAYDSSGQWVAQFGSTGTGNGQFKVPVGVAVAPVTGNLLVVDAANGRVQEFRSTGEYIRQFGAAGIANNQLKEPRGVALAPDGTAYVADAGNKRIAKWTHAAYDPQSGIAKTEVKVDGSLVDSHTPTCGTSCAVAREWTLNADQFSVGQHSLSVTAVDDVGLSRTTSVPIETHGDLAAPAVALSGSMTEQGSLGSTRPAYTLKVNATDPGGVEERKSGVASTTVKVDGATVDSTSPGCAAGGCSIAREWTLSSNSYSVGSHSVQVTATDAAGRATTKSLTIAISRDTTAPEIVTTGAFNAFFNRPEGWVEQKNYWYAPQATDLNGYGVTSMSFKLDGAVIESKSQSCAVGSCPTNLLGTLNMTNYDGGAHTAEVIATDGAGNTRKRIWTINVDPEGHVSVTELEDTLEAVDATADSLIIAPTADVLGPQERADGNNPSLIESGSELESRGAPTPSAISTDPEDGFTIVTPDTTVNAQPVGVSAGSTEVGVVDGSVAVAGSTKEHADMVIRPIFNGLTTFSTIRNASAPETYSWKVELEPGQTLVSVDPLDAEIKFENGRRAMLIAAEPAHDAVGTPVETTLSVSGEDILTLTVHHRIAGIVYPVVGGAGWEGGYTSEMIVGPQDDQEIKEERERIRLEEIEFFNSQQAAQEMAAGSEDEPNAGSPENFDPTVPMNGGKILRFKFSPPEVVDWATRKKRSRFEGGRCAWLGCDVWSSYMYGTFFHNGVKGKKGGFAWPGDTVAKCETEDDWWIDNDLNGVGWGGSIPAPYGDGKHLTFWCNFTLRWLNATGPEEDRYQMFMHLYGSGYYSAAKAYKYPPPILEG
jgi:sugar lactone lactonase YvrE